MEALNQKVKYFRAGGIKNRISAWKNITSDKFILDIVQHGLKLNFADTRPVKGPFEYPRSMMDTDIIDNELQSLLQKGVITVSTIEDGDYFSSLFTREKKDGSYRTILNLKLLNEECETHHFKMESLRQAIHMVRPGAFLASIDIKDAFYSVPIHQSHKKYLKFIWRATPYQFEAMPNGYLDAMRIFAKLLKPIFATLRKLGYVSIIYVDDTLLYGDTFEECLRNVIATLDILQEMGFTIHAKKSALNPSQQIIFLGFIFNTVNMTIRLTEEKKLRIYNLADTLLNRQVSIRIVSRFIGNLTAAFDGVTHGRLYYRHIEFDKTVALSMSAGNYESHCELSQEAIKEVLWWKEHIMDSYAIIKDNPKIDYIIHTDASQEGWGASDGTLSDINGRWSMGEQNIHINVLELKAIKLAILSYLPLQKNIKHIRIRSDNTTAIAYINKQGGSHCMHLNDMAVDIWETCIAQGVTISAAHIPGAHNVLADAASREFRDAAEWAIPQKIFGKIVKTFGCPEIDLFASRLNKKLPKYVSWKPDPESIYIDSMNMSWENLFIYLFPPFSMLWPITTKLELDRVPRAIIVMPDWPTQSWYPRIMRKSLSPPMKISSSSLILPGTRRTHPLAPKLQLLAVVVSWKDN